MPLLLPGRYIERCNTSTPGDVIVTLILRAFGFLAPSPGAGS